MSALYLIRHGRTEANRRRLYCGSTDLPLDEEGLEELAALRDLYRDLAGCRFITSGMARTEQTLSALFGDVPHETVPGLREIDFGVFEMHSWEQLRDRADYQAWISGDNEKNVPPGGESGVQMTARVLAAFRTLDLREDTVIVTHGGVIAAIMAHLFPGEGKNRYQWQPEPGLGYRVEGSGWRPLEK